MQSKEAIETQIERLMPTASLEDFSLDREMARNIIHTLTWVLGECSPEAYPPAELIGWTTFNLTPERLEVIRFTSKQLPDDVHNDAACRG